jgi:hypothetical protein
MGTGWIGVIVAAVSLFVAAPGLPAQSGAARSVPDLSGVWEGPFTPLTDICGEPNCAALLKRKQEPSPDTFEEPEMLPWAEEYFKKLHQGIALTANPPEHLNPSWNGCLPEGPVQPLPGRFFRIELRQFPDAVFLFHSTDHAVRRVYLDGRNHPANLKPSWMGHSIGRYEGDTLVIDTVGIKDTAWVDGKGHPHTDALRLEERIRRISPDRLEIQITIDDPKTYKKPWKMKLIKGLRAPGPELWDTGECEELLQMETHFSAERPSAFSKESPPTSY